MIKIRLIGVGRTERKGNMVSSREHAIDTMRYPSEADVFTCKPYVQPADMLKPPAVCELKPCNSILLFFLVYQVYVLVN
jgi:hypothetical protein